MKKLIALLLSLCLVLGVSSAALAAGAPKIYKQPESKVREKNNQVTFSISADNYDQKESGWRFVNPDTGEEFNVVQLRDEVFKEFKFDYKATNRKQKVTLLNVPDSMHGWEVYMHLSMNGFSIDSERVRLWCFDPAEGAPASTTDVPSDTPADTPAEPAPSADVPETSDPETFPAEDIPEAEQSDPEAPKIITVTADKLTLCPVDARGNLLEDQAAPSLTFENSGSVAVRSDAPVKYWLINGIRIEPVEDVTGFVLKNITTDLSISAKLSGGSDASEIDPDTPCQVTCTGCVFTYHKGNLSSVSSGTVPLGASIIVFTDSADAAAKGYSINGADPDHVGSTSFRLKIEGDTTITIP